MVRKYYFISYVEQEPIRDFYKNTVANIDPIEFLALYRKKLKKEQENKKNSIWNLALLFYKEITKAEFENYCKKFGYEDIPLT